MAVKLNLIHQFNQAWLVVCKLNQQIVLIIIGSNLMNVLSDQLQDKNRYSIARF